MHQVEVVRPHDPPQFGPVTQVISTRRVDDLDVSPLCPRALDEGARTGVCQDRQNHLNSRLGQPGSKPQNGRFRAPHGPRGNGMQHSRVATGPQMGCHDRNLSHKSV